MQEIMKKAEALADRYREQLASAGVAVVLTERCTETEVEERSGGSTGVGQALFAAVARAHDRNREEEKGYDYEDNRYRCLILRVVPLDTKLVSRTECREYAFVLEKTERAHLGQEPVTETCKEAELLAKVEKRILKILRRAEKKTPQKICKNTLWDAFRYMFSVRYAYKEYFCGKGRSAWEVIFPIAELLILVAIAAAGWGIVRCF